MEDSEIVEMYWRREEQAIAESSKKYGGLLMHIANGILANHEDSEECVNDTYGKAWYAIPPARPFSLMAYLGRIVRNLAVNRWEERHAAKRDAGLTVLLSELSDCVPDKSNVEQELEGRLLTEEIEKWLRTLPQEDRMLFLRRYWFGDDLRELAARQKVSAKQLASKLYRLRQKLRATLEIR